MEDPREIFLRVARAKGSIQIDEACNTSVNIKEHILNTIFYIIVDYIKYERETHEEGFGPIEATYFCTNDFMNSEDARKWIDENTSGDDLYLIMYVFDNCHLMYSSKHRRALLYLINMLYFDL